MITVEELKVKTAELREIKNQKASLNAEISVLSDKESVLERVIMEALEESGLTKFSVEGIGTVYSQEKLSVRTPKTEEDRAAFYGYLKDIGEYDSLSSISSMTLNAWYKAKVDAGITDIPGLKEVVHYRQVVLRK